MHVYTVFGCSELTLFPLLFLSSSTSSVYISGTWIFIPTSENDLATTGPRVFKHTSGYKLLELSVAAARQAPAASGGRVTVFFCLQRHCVSAASLRLGGSGLQPCHWHLSFKKTSDVYFCLCLAACWLVFTPLHWRHVCSIVLNLRKCVNFCKFATTRNFDSQMNWSEESVLYVSIASLQHHLW